MADEIDQLQTDISKAALKMPSALTPAYKASLDAVDLLENGHVHGAVTRLRDAEACARRGADRTEFRELADRAEELDRAGEVENAVGPLLGPEMDPRDA